MAKKFGKFLMFSAAVAAAAGAYYYFKKSDEDRFDDDDFDNDFDFDEEEKDLSGGKERSYVPLRFSTVKSEEETAAEEAKEDVPAVEEVKGAVSPAAEGKEETPAPEPKEEEKEKSAETKQADDEPFDEEDKEPIDNVESSTETIEEFFDEEEDNK